MLTSDAEHAFLDEKARASLAEWRGDLGALLRRSVDALQFDGTTLTWWTFAGGRINQTLKYALEWMGSWKVVPDNFALKIQGDGLGFETFEKAVKELRAAGFWDDPEARRKLLAMVPEYRLSKFQRVLPDRWQVEMVEMVGAYLLDFEGSRRFLSG